MIPNGAQGGNAALTACAAWAYPGVRIYPAGAVGRTDGAGIPGTADQQRGAASRGREIALQAAKTA